MKARELMAGDYLQYNGMPYRVIQVNGIVGDSFMLENGEENCGDPIPLTFEIFEKNGWEVDGRFARIDIDATSYLSWSRHQGVLRKYFLHKEGLLQVTFMSPTGVVYVHELQQVLRLIRNITKCGLIKEIEL